MATIEVPDSLLEPWPRYDEAWRLLQASAASGGISRQGIGNMFTTIAGPAPWQNPSFSLWSYIRHGAASYGDLQQLLVGTRTDSHPDRKRPFLSVDDDEDDEDEASISGGF